MSQMFVTPVRELGYIKAALAEIFIRKILYLKVEKRL